MLQDKNTQYINIKQYDKQLKIDNQILTNGKISKTEHSSFLVEDKLSLDAINKLNILQKNINKTYVTTICESLNQKIVDDDFVDNNFEVKKLTSHLHIAIPKSDLFKQEEYFKSTGLDYVFSPFSILYNHILIHGVNANSLNILILNNTVYALILNDQQKIVFSSIKTLTAFDDVRNSEFYTDGIEGQQLFDEVHSLEIQEILTSITNEFYEQINEDMFCESIAIFYTIKQLNDEQLQKIQETMMLEIEYSTILIDEYLFSLSKQLHVSIYSFSEQRKKQDRKPFIIWIFGAILSTALVAGVLYFMQLKEEEEKNRVIEEKEAKIIADKKIELDKIKLPNHKMENEKISKLILNIFDIIPYNAILNELQLQKRDSTIVCSFLQKDTFTKDIQLRLLKIYKTSEILLMQHNKPTYNAIIASEQILPQKLSAKQIQPNYKYGKFISRSKVVNQIKAFLPKETKVIFKSKQKSKFLTYNFNIVTILETPTDFFNFIEELNKKNYSLNISYPIEFAQTTKGLETSFNLKFHQFQSK